MSTNKQFTVFQSKKNGKWYWNLKNEFQIIYAHGGHLDSKQTAIEACQSVQSNAPIARIVVE